VNVGEVFNFRFIRGPQRLASTLDTGAYPPPRVIVHEMAMAPPSDVSPFFASLKHGDQGRVASMFVATPAFLGRGHKLEVPLRDIDAWLAAKGNRAAPADVLAAINPRPTDLIAEAKWRATRVGLADSLVASIVDSEVEPTVRSELTRLILVAALVEDLARDAVAAEDDVYERLRRRTVILPPEILTFTASKARLARRYGFAEQVVVRDEWHEYRFGELAHVENALAGEFRERRTRQLTETETSTSTETETVKSEETDTQSTDRFEMSDHATQDISLAAHVDGKVDVSAQYASAKIDAHVGGSFDYAREDAHEQSTTIARETVARAVKKVETRVQTLRTTRELERFVERNLHRIDNTQAGAGNRVAFYRWVDKIQRLQAFYYPHRFLLEVEVPEPAAFVRWRRKRADQGFLNPDPPAFVALDAAGEESKDADGKTRPLKPTDLSPDMYLNYVTRYRLTGVEQPPPTQIIKALPVEFKASPGDPTGGYEKSYEDKTEVDLVAGGDGQQDSIGVQLPEGYRLTQWSVELQTYLSTPAKLSDGHDVLIAGSADPLIKIAVGQDVLAGVRDAAQDVDARPSVFRASFNIPAARPPVTNSVPVTFWAGRTREFSAHLELKLERQPDHLMVWQLQLVDQLSAEYRLQQERHFEEAASKAVGNGVEIQGSSPTRNAEVVREEIKRSMISLLSNGRYPPAGASTGLTDDDTGPQFDLDYAARTGPEVQFIEQAFEWENMTYVLYPYYWADKANWVELADIESEDAEFDRFLRCGSARVVVPARPGLEDQVRIYVDTGVLWGGGPVPAPGDPEYISVAEEIKAMGLAPPDGESGEWWDIKLPTTLVAIDSAVALPLTNPAPTVGPLPAPAP
jgi:hypothetical protein